jgi:hypothetical protein
LPCFADDEQPVGLIHVATGKLTLDGSPLGNEAIGFLTLDPNQKLRVVEGLLEVELLEGAYLRAAEGAEIRLLSKDPQQIRVEVLEGPAILAGSKKLLDSIVVEHAGNAVRFSDTGYYRLDVAAGTEARLTVVKGRALVETPAGSQQLKGKQSIALTGAATVEKVRKIDKDELMQWSRDRQDEYVLSRRRQKGFADLAIPGTIRQ